MTREEMEICLEDYCKESMCTEDCLFMGKVCAWSEETDEEIESLYNMLPKEKTEIKDSGERTQFFDGNGNPIGVRDMHEGKGRLDLLPCTAILELAKHSENGCKKYGERSVDKGIPQHSFIDSGLRHLFKYLRGDKDENHLVSALWNIAWAVEQDVNKPELNDLPWAKEE